MSFLKKKMKKNDSFGDLIEKEYEDQFSEKMLEILRQDDSDNFSDEKSKKKLKKKKKVKKKKSKKSVKTLPFKEGNKTDEKKNKKKKKSKTLSYKSSSKKKEKNKENSKEKKEKKEKKHGKKKKKRSTKNPKEVSFGLDISDEEQNKEIVEEKNENEKKKIEETKKGNFNDSLDFVLSDDDSEEEIELSEEQKKESKVMLEKINEKMESMITKISDLNEKEEEEKKRKKDEERRKSVERKVRKDIEEKKKKEEEKRKSIEKRRRKEDERKKKELEKRKSAERKMKKDLEEKRRKQDERRKSIEDRKRRKVEEEEERKKKELAKYLKDLERYQAKIHDMLQEGGKNIMKKINDIVVEKFVDVNALYKGFTILHWACFYNDLKTVKGLLKIDEVGINVLSGKHSMGWRLTPLMVACQKSHTEIVKVLLSEKRVVDIDAQSKAGKTAWDFSSSDIIKKVLDSYKKFVEGDKKIISERIEFIQSKLTDYAISTVTEDEKIEVLKTSKFFLHRSEYLRKKIRKKKKIEIEYKYTVEKVLEYLFGMDPKIKKTKLYDVFVLSMKWKLYEFAFSIVRKLQEKLNLFDFLKILNQILEMSFVEDEVGGFEKTSFTYAILKKIKNDHLEQLETPKVLKLISGFHKKFKKILNESIYDDFTHPVVNHKDLKGLNLAQKDLSSINLLQIYFSGVDLSQVDDTNLELFCSDIGKKVCVHKEVISFRFQFFKKVLAINPGIDELIIDRFNFEELDTFVKFTYSFKSKLKGENKTPAMLLKSLEFLDEDERDVFVVDLIETLKKIKKEMIGFIIKNGYYLKKIKSESGEKIRNFLDNFLEKETLQQLIDYSTKMNEKIVKLKNELRKCIEESE